MPLWFDILTKGDFDENSFNKEDAIVSAHKIIEVIDQEVKDNLDGNYKRLWIVGRSQGVWQGFLTITLMEQNIGGLMSLQGGFEPLVKISEVPENKKSIKIIIFASGADTGVTWDYSLDQEKKLKEHGFDVEFYSDPDILHYPFDVKIWDYVREPLIRNMYNTTYKITHNEG